MKEIVKRIKIIIVVLIAGWTLFGYFAIYFPMKTELKNNLYQYNLEISNTKFTAFSANVKKSEEGARSLSSRTMIRDKIVSYQNGSVNLDELRDYTQPKYLDGVKALDDVVAAARYVNHDIVAEFTTDYFSLESLGDADESIAELCTEFLMKEGELYLVVRSPILIEQRVLGVDCVVYRFTDRMEMLNDTERKAMILSDRGCSQLLEHSRKISMNSDDRDSAMIEKNQKLYFVRSVIPEYYLVVETEKSCLLEPVYALTIRILVSEAVFFAGMLLFVYFYILRSAGHRLYASEKSIAEYRQMLNRDDLTGAYSRAYLEYWKENFLNEEEQHTVIMSDIDDFKKINDTYGHLAGDEALKAVAETMQSVVGDNDIVIRFGGDEFLLVLKGIGEVAAQEVMKRIQMKLAERKKFAFILSVSYGISEVNNKINFNSAIEIADERMYASKQSKKRGREQL